MQPDTFKCNWILSSVDSLVQNTVNQAPGCAMLDPGAKLATIHHVPPDAPSGTIAAIVAEWTKRPGVALVHQSFHGFPSD